MFNCGMAFHYLESLAKKKLIIMLPKMPLAKFAVGAFAIIDDFKSGRLQSIVLQKISHSRIV